MTDPLSATVSVHGLTKRYGTSTVLDHVSLAVATGEIRALLGGNGAGKSTLIKILSGVVRADAGWVGVGGVPTVVASPRDASAAGIATLHQELAIVPGLSVAENVLLGRPTPHRLGCVRWGTVNARARELFALLGQDIDVRQDAARLSPVAKTMTAIARALSLDARLLILDEPTASLTDQETSQLFTAVRNLAASGVGVLYVSHRLDEIVSLCGTFSVLRNGQLVADGAVAQTSPDALITAMAGRSFDALFPPRASVPAGAPRLVARGLVGKVVRDADLDLATGEIVGIAGLAGSGRSELLRLVAGAQRKHRGSITVDGRPLTRGSLPEAQAAGVALVPQERRSDGLVPDTIERNVNLTRLRALSWGGAAVARRRSSAHARENADRLDVVRQSLRQQVLTLSGGNQQKILLAKFLALDPSVLLLDEPTRGVDVGTKAEIYSLLRSLAETGTAVCVVSSELSELIGLCDRIVVLQDGAKVADLSAAGLTEEGLLNACYGRVPVVIERCS